MAQFVSGLHKVCWLCPIKWCLHARTCIAYMYRIHVRSLFTRAHRYCVHVCTCISLSKEAWRMMTSYRPRPTVARKKFVLAKRDNGRRCDYCHNLISLLCTVASAIVIIWRRHQLYQRRGRVWVCRNWVTQRNTERGIGSFVLSELMILDTGGSHSFQRMTPISFVRCPTNSSTSSHGQKDRTLSCGEA